MSNIPSADRLIHALDVPDAEVAKQRVLELGNLVNFYKIGLELFTSRQAFALIDWLYARQKKIFLDLKLFDIPATVGRAVRQLNQLPVNFITVHGNDRMLSAASEARDINTSELKILAVTSLTSLDQNDLNDLGFDCDVETLVLSRARRALACGCDGVISSGLEAQQIKQETATRLIIITPGIRPLSNQPSDDQKRVTDVATAFNNGADYIVVGRPIRDAADPQAVAQQIQHTIVQTLGE